VGALPEDGTGLVVNFPEPIATDSVMFTVTESTGGNVGLREFEAYGIVGAPTGPILRPPPPAAPGGPNSNSINVPREVTLNWSLPEGGIENISEVIVYLGTTMDPPAVQTLTSLTPSMSYSAGTLAANTQYFWRIDTVNSDGTATGTTRSFTTRQAANGDIQSAEIGGSGSVNLFSLGMLLLLSVWRLGIVRRNIFKLS